MESRRGTQCVFAGESPIASKTLKATIVFCSARVLHTAMMSAFARIKGDVNRSYAIAFARPLCEQITRGGPGATFFPKSLDF
jgi:hypothetical protein